MDTNKTGLLLRTLRQEQGLTQKQLADKLHISDKTISKWERGIGCPDIAMLPELSRLLDVNIDDILRGERDAHAPVGGNMRRCRYFVCPQCGSLTLCSGTAAVSCCGRKREPLDPHPAEPGEALRVEEMEDEWYITGDHPMEKDHYIAFVAFVTDSQVTLVKQYPEWALQARLWPRRHGLLLWYCTRDGLFSQRI